MDHIGAHKEFTSRTDNAGKDVPHSELQHPTPAFEETPRKEVDAVGHDAPGGKPLHDEQHGGRRHQCRGDACGAQYIINGEGDEQCGESPAEGDKGNGAQPTQSSEHGHLSAR